MSGCPARKSTDNRNKIFSLLDTRESVMLGHPVVYREPEENFVSIEDARIQQFLLKIAKDGANVSSKQSESLPTTIVLDEDDSSNQSERHSPVVFDIASKPAEEIIVIDDDDENDEISETPRPCDEEPNNDENVNTFNLSKASKGITRKMSVTCNFCGRCFKSIYTLRRHTLSHTGEMPYSCDRCNQRFREYRDVKRHRKLHAPDIKCLACGKNPPSDRDPTRCLPCLKKKTAAPELVRITETPHVEVPEEKQANIAERKKTLRRPKKSAKKHPLVCLLCKRTFATAHNLKRHSLIHTGEKPFSCDICQKPFRERSTLKKHMIVHKHAHWYKCVLCIYRSMDYLQYSAHVESHRIVETASSQELECEEDNESGGDIIRCCECLAELTSTDALIEHLMTHEHNEYLCMTCEMQFKSLIALKKHMNKEHNIFTKN